MISFPAFFSDRNLRSAIGTVRCREPSEAIQRSSSPSWRTNLLCSSTMTRLTFAEYVELLVGLLHAICIRVVHLKKLPRNAIKTRIDTTCPAAAIVHQERRHADCKSSRACSLVYYIRSPIAGESCKGERSGTRLSAKLVDWLASLATGLFLAMPDRRFDFIPVDLQARLRRKGCHVSRLGRILIKRASIASRVHLPVRLRAVQRATFVQLISTVQILILFWHVIGLKYVIKYFDF